jgi:hypothetical protein
MNCDYHMKMQNAFWVDKLPEPKVKNFPVNEGLHKKSRILAVN